MLQLSIGTEVGVCDGVPRYERHRPERTLLYQLVEEYYPVFEVQWAAEGRALPDYVRRADGPPPGALHHLPHRGGSASGPCR